MKRKFIMLVAILLLTTACSGSSLKSINLKSLNNLFDKKESFVLYLTDESEEGKILKKTLKEVTKDNKIKSYYLNTEKLKDSDLEKLKENITFKETNIIIFIKKGEEETVLSRIDDTYISKEKLKQEFKNQGYIE